MTVIVKRVPTNSSYVLPDRIAVQIANTESCSVPFAPCIDPGTGKPPTCFEEGCNIREYMRYSYVREPLEYNLKNVRLELWHLDIIEHLERYPIRFFRVHASGDFRPTNSIITNQEYLDGWFELGERFPNTQFLAFTKAYELDFSKRTDNFKIFFSAWPGLDMLDTDFPVAWLYDRNNPDPRIPKNIHKCHSRCDQCPSCFRKKACDVVLVKR
jgi:hypothetical protein